MKNSGKEIPLDPFKQVGNYDLAVNKLDRKEIESLEKAGVNINKTLKLPEPNRKLPPELTTTSNFKPCFTKACRIFRIFKIITNFQSNI